MKYFAEYVPVEGEIRNIWLEVNGMMGKYRNEDDRFIYIQTPDGHVWSRLKEGARTYYKLFLCSRDIQIGDKYYDEVVKEWFTCVNRSEYKYQDGGTTINIESDTEGVNIENALKVIGEISSDAIWVKRGDEFDENEVKLGARSSQQSQYYFPWREDARKQGYECVALIKGPCGHFH